MQEENRSTQRKTCGSKFGLESKWTYSAAPGPGIEPGLSGPQPDNAEEVPLRYLLN